jgi:hypothetical protein
MNRGGDPGVDSEAARREAQAALEQMQEALEQLTAGRRMAADEAFSSLSERASDVFDRQRRGADALRQAIEDARAERDANNASATRLDNETADQLSDERYQLADDVAALEEEMQRIAQQFRRQAPEATRELDDALADLQETQASANLESGASLIWRREGDRVAGFDPVITSALRDLERNAERAEALALREVVEGEIGERDPNEQIVAQLRSVRRQLAQATGQRGRPGQQGQQAQQGQGQQGQGGQQGQQGQGGQQGGNQQAGGGGFGGVNFGPNDGGFVDVNSGVWGPANDDFWNDPAAVENLSEQLGVAGNELINLRARLRGEGISNEELRAVQELGDALRAGLRGNPELIETEFQNLVNLTEQLELQLRADGNASETTVRTEAPSPVAQGFEDTVAEYYRRLSRSSD